MSPHRWFGAAGLVSLLTLTLASGCGDDDDRGRGENTGSSCGSPADCYPNVQDTTAIQGEIQCMDRVPGGYCTHFCSTDADCCAVPGECQTGHPQVCAPFESTGQFYCFLSCETADWQNSGVANDNDYCHRFAGPAFNCRSTGGGAQNRKVCVP
jgi:hypothetical protein